MTVKAGTMMSDAILSADQLVFSRKGHRILDKVSVQIRASEITTLIGPNGAGKTSLVRILLGLDEPDAGSIHRLDDLRIAYVPQKVSVPQELPMRVRDLLLLSREVEYAQISEVLKELAVAHLEMKAVQQLSGGELQRVLLARALLKQPQLLVLDEPAQGLDVMGQQALYRTIAGIREQHGCAVLMVSHDLHLVMAQTDNVICLNSHVCCTGHPDDVSEHPEYIKLFGSAIDGLAVYSHHHDHEHDMHGNIIESDAAGCTSTQGCTGHHD